MIRAAALFIFLAASPSVLQALELPQGARLLSERVVPLDSYALPTAGFDGQHVPARTFEGQVERRNWRVDSGSATPLQLLAPLRDQLIDSGYDVVFQCRAHDCGGFDFRFGTEIAPAPHMHVDIGNFRFLSAIRNDNEALSLLVSRTGTSAYIQEIHVLPAAALAQGTAADELEAEASEEAPQAAGQAGTLIDALLTHGHVILSDLEFGTGANVLGAGPYGSLTQLADFLADNPTYRIVLVGHTDSIGALDANIALSKRRAESVRDRLVADYGVAPDRIAAEGMGYLAPVAPNLTPEGRERNRRVEAILLPMP